MNIAIIFAGGVGKRMGKNIPKQFILINEKPIIIYTLELFEKNELIDKIYISTLEEYIPYVYDLIKKYNIKKVDKVIKGSDTALGSIYNGLVEASKYNDENSIVLIHDGVRPIVNQEVITQNIENVKKYGSAITCTHAFETIILSEDGNKIDSVPLRKNSFTAQAPQSFILKDIIEAHNEIRKTNSKYVDIVDCCTMMKTLGKDVHIVEGNRGNIKITTPEDVYNFKAYLDYNEAKQAFGIDQEI